MRVNFKNTIGITLLRCVFSVYFIITIIVTTIQLFAEYKDTREKVYQDLENFAGTLESSLAQSTWNYDIDQIESTLEGIKKIKLILGAKIVNTEQKTFAEYGNIYDSKQFLSYQRVDGNFNGGSITQITYQTKNKKETIYEYKLPIKYHDEFSNTDEIISHFYIYTNESVIVDRVKYGFILIILSAVIKTITLWFIFLYFIRRLIVNPLNTLTEASLALKAEDLHSTEETIQDNLIQQKTNEVDVLTSTFYKMRISIREKITLIEKQNSQLEEKVKERTLKLEQKNKDLEYFSYHDMLTGLPNRRLLNEKVKHIIDNFKHNNNKFCLALMEFKEFKKINDNYGHHAGDIVLKKMTQRIHKLLNHQDLIARIGGDEFVILLTSTNHNNLGEISNRLLSCEDSPVIYNDKKITPAINIGYAFYPEHGEDFEKLLRSADMAMYEAKKSMRKTSIFSAALDEKINRKELIKNELIKAIEENSLSLYYQPIIDITHKNIYKVEALLRWDHENLGFISPAEFIPIAERTNIIDIVSEWVIQQVLNDLNIIDKRGYRFGVSINLSGQLIADEVFMSKLEQKFRHNDLSNNPITIELTESSAMKSSGTELKSMHQLKSLGFKLSIDDFGTGYSSFSYLAQLPVDELKIDRSFLFDASKNSMLIIKAIISLAHRLNLHVVTEGIEDARTLKIIKDMGSDYIQGFYFSKALPLDKLFEWIENTDLLTACQPQQ